LVRVKGFAPHGFEFKIGIMFYVYVLRSESDDGFYIGFSADLRRRLKAHQDGKSFATSYRGPWKLIYYEAYLEEADALGRERYLKSGGGRRFMKSQLKHYLERPRKALRATRF
jgi:putative endonuclease